MLDMGMYVSLPMNLNILLTQSERDVLNVIRHCENLKRERISNSVFCVMTGLSENTIRKARDSLKKIGLVEQFDIRTLGTKYKVKYDTLCPMIIKLNAEKNPVERLRLADKLRGKGREKNQKLIEMFQGSEFDFNC